MLEPSQLTWHLEKLPYFVTAAECGSFRQAALKLKMAQPSLSKSIHILEEACGTLLFDRRKQGVSLTPAGETLLIAAKEMIRIAVQTQNQLATDGQENKSISLVTHELLVPLFMPHLRRLLHAKKAVRFQIQTHASVRHLIDKIDDYEADVGIIANSPVRPRIHMEPLFEQGYGFFASKRYCADRGLLDQSQISMAALAEHPLIVAPKVLAGTQETLDDHLKRRGLLISPRHVVDVLESVAGLAAHDFGIGILPDVIGPHLQAGKLLRLPVKIPGGARLGLHRFNFCCRKDAWKRDATVMQVFQSARDWTKALVH